MNFLRRARAGVYAEGRYRIGHALRAVGWMIPAKIRVFPTSERAAAKVWVAGEGS
jgi:hypothetical protein